MLKVLLVEDEPSLAMLIRDNLEQSDYEVVQATDGDQAVSVYREQAPDIILLDVMLPRRDGFEVAGIIRAADLDTPILFLTSRARPKDVVRGFEAGGNDYLKKPFGIEELLVRMKVLLSDKRLLSAGPPPADTHTIGRYELDVKKRQLVCRGQAPTQLTVREAELLQLFCQNRDELLRKETILLQIWEDDAFLNSRSLDVFISRLRRYLRHDPNVEIVNHRGLGYRLVVHD
ncbi:response regulator transcription factor [Flavilitoribacter nigricans]|uniref:DNA-binding response regulator n=1 Tax=Flavilitoribacter nigricans (strain ATCC 23147 / DSM 23189 / NBRC 102662 / NCIMB 1420 / SS-2) TaxID=1122177 RepID=A0A2D0MZB6_FLAN2|nr:response regulator transcription factor [Flavilitoribacter nigricans]PHN01595.1 DNA-binding response regulator [Flavilitoribacter nigricans DSM 23189 = NBRC 102662]